jgi:hypothetical protein
MNRYVAVTFVLLEMDLEALGIEVFLRDTIYLDRRDFERTRNHAIRQYIESLHRSARRPEMKTETRVAAADLRYIGSYIDVC